MPLLSVVIPVYNLESLVSKCVESILSQSFQDYEIILVNDGSKDSSGTICEQFNSNHPDKVRVVHQENQGLSSARNSGLGIARGIYVWFVDGDDTVSPDALYLIAERLVSGADIYLLDHYNCYTHSEKQIYHKYFQGTRMKGSFVLKINGAIPAWASVYRKDFLISNCLTFTPRLIHEDFEFSIRSYTLADSVEHLNQPLYNYICDRNGSIMNTSTAKSPIGYAKCASYLTSFITQYSIDGFRKKIVLQTAAIGITFSILRCKGLKDVEWSKVVNYYKDNLDIICNVLSQSTVSHKLLSVLMRINVDRAIKIYILLKS